MKKIMLLVMVFLSSRCFAGEQITSFGKETISVLNEELRRSRSDIDSFGRERKEIESRIDSAIARLSIIDSKIVENSNKVITNLCRISSTTITRSLTNTGTSYTQIGSAGDEVDENASTSYGGSASGTSGFSSSVVFTDTIVFDDKYDIDSVYFKAFGSGGGGNGGGSWVANVKLYNSSGSVLGSYGNGGGGSPGANGTVDSTYTDGWKKVKYAVVTVSGSGSGQFGSSARAECYEIQIWGKI